MLLLTAVTPRKLSGSRRESPKATTGGGGKHIAHVDDGVEGSGLQRTTYLGVFVTGAAFPIDRQHVECAAAAVAAVTGVELDADHGKCIDADTEGALSET
ncbi:hypothetical protein IBA8401_49690 [Pseudomonas syringae]